MPKRNSTGPGAPGRRCLPFLVAILALGLTACEKKREQSPGTFVQIRETGKAEGVLETSVTHYENDAGLRVDLVSAVHIGEASYYEELNERFRSYDAVLYELVAERGRRPETDKKNASIVSQLQRGMKSILALEFQLDGIDYSRPNFVHADLDPKGLSDAFAATGDSLLRALIRMSLAGQKMEGKSLTPVHLLASLFTKHRAQYLKYIFAQQMRQMDALFAAMGQGDKGQSFALIGARNQACIDVLEKQIEAGKKKLAIFYGAAHMPDLEERLWKLGFWRTGEEWLLAWDARREKPAESPQDK